MTEWEYRQVLVCYKEGQEPQVLLDGEPVDESPEQVMSRLWESGWEQEALWFITIEREGRLQEVPHQIRYRRRRRDEETEAGC